LLIQSVRGRCGRWGSIGADDDGVFGRALGSRTIHDCRRRAERQTLARERDGRGPRCARRRWGGKVGGESGAATKEEGRRQRSWSEMAGSSSVGGVVEFGGRRRSAFALGVDLSLFFFEGARAGMERRVQRSES